MSKNLPDHSNGRTNSNCQLKKVLTPEWPIVQDVQRLLGTSHFFQWQGQLKSPVRKTLRACDKILSLSNKDKTILLHFTPEFEDLRAPNKSEWMKDLHEFLHYMRWIIFIVYGMLYQAHLKHVDLAQNL